MNIYMYMPYDLIIPGVVCFQVHFSLQGSHILAKIGTYPEAPTAFAVVIPAIYKPFIVLQADSCRGSKYLLIRAI
jgi:hypothetical protein